MDCPPLRQGTPPFPSLYNPFLERYGDCEQPYSSVTHLENAGDIFRFTLYWTLILYTPVFALPALWGLFVHLVPHRLSRRRGVGFESTNDLPFSTLSPERQNNNVQVLSPRSSEPFLLGSATLPVSKDRSTVNLGETTRSQPQPQPQPQPQRPNIHNVAQTFDSWTPNRTLRTLRRRHADSFALAPTSPLLTAMSHPSSARARFREHSLLRNRSTGVTFFLLTIPLAFIIIGAVVGVIGSLVIGYLLAALKGTAGVTISTWLPLGWAVIQVCTLLLG